MTVYDDLVGQGPVIEQLRSAARAGAEALTGEGGGGMTHAWLFTGPPGSGRSVAARAFAAALLCPDQGCGHCPSCHQVLSGTLPNPNSVSAGILLEERAISRSRDNILSISFTNCALAAAPVSR